MLCVVPDFAISLSLRSNKIVLALLLGSCSNSMYHNMYFLFLLSAVGTIGLDLPFSSLTIQSSQNLALTHSLVYFGYRGLYHPTQVASLCYPREC